MRVSAFLHLPLSLVLFLGLASFFLIAQPYAIVLPLFCHILFYCKRVEACLSSNEREKGLDQGGRRGGEELGWAGGKL